MNVQYSRLLLLLALLTAASPALDPTFSQAQTPETAPAAAARVTPTPTPDAYDEGWGDAGLGIFACLFFMLIIVLLGVGIVLGMVLVVVARRWWG